MLQVKRDALKIRIYGEKGGIEWAQMEPNTLLVKWLDKPAEVYRAGQAYLSDIEKHNVRTPGGHPEGYLEAFANIYRNFALSLMAKMNGETPTAAMMDYPKVDEGVRGMAFIDTVVASSQSDKKWTDFVV